jgi:Tfp pilus assembly protein PilE
MRKKTHMRRALSMVELIFVMIVLGIVATIGSEIIAQTFESYIVQRAQYRAAIKSEAALNQIANRLRYAIPGTIMARQTASSAPVPIGNVAFDNAEVLQWVAYDGDSFEAMTSTSRKPGWSGVLDLDACTKSILNTPGSNLDLADEIIGNLGGDITRANIFFPDGTRYGIGSVNDESITLDNDIPAGNSIYERYKLAWSGYAIKMNGSDMYLVYRMSPVAGANLVDTESLLLRNVENFRFKGSEGSLRIKLCVNEPISKDTNITSCKEKVIF